MSVEAACWIKCNPDTTLPGVPTPFELLFGLKPRSTQLDALLFPPASEESASYSFDDTVGSRGRALAEEVQDALRS